MKKRTVFILVVLATGFDAKADDLFIRHLAQAQTFAAPICDQEIAYKKGEKTFVDCRWTGQAAQETYLNLKASEKYFRDADGGPGGFIKSSQKTYCYASLNKTTFQCDQLLPE
jgi:hypothetical protein